MELPTWRTAALPVIILISQNDRWHRAFPSLSNSVTTGWVLLMHTLLLPPQKKRIYSVYHHYSNTCSKPRTWICFLALPKIVPRAAQVVFETFPLHLKKKTHFTVSPTIIQLKNNALMSYHKVHLISIPALCGNRDLFAERSRLMCGGTVACANY